MYVCDFGFDISMTHVCIMIEKVCFEFKKSLA